MIIEIENARIVLSKDLNVIWANLEDQDSDDIIKLGRGKVVNNELQYEYNDNLIYLSTYSFKGIGERLPEIIDALSRNIGEQKTQELLIRKLKDESTDLDELFPNVNIKEEIDTDIMKEKNNLIYNRT